MPFVARPYQIEDLAQLIGTPNKPLLSDAGTGKTPTACLYTQYAFNHLGYKTVWIMPSSLLGKNYEDLKEFGGFTEEEVIIVQGTAERRAKLMASPKAKVFIMTAQCWTNNWRLFMNMQPTIRVVMGDEWHLYFSSHKSKRTQEMYAWSKYMFSVVPMTGSAIKGRLDSVYPIFHAFFPLYYGTWEQFMARHAEYDENGRVAGWRNHDQLNVLLKKLTIRRSFKEVYGAENKVLQLHRVRMCDAHQDIYSRWKTTHTIERDEDMMRADGNAAIVALRSRQILAHPDTLGVVPSGGHFETQKDVELASYIEDALFSGERLVLFSVWKPEQERMVKLIQKMGGKVGLINGDVSANGRTKVDQDFCANRLQFIVASPATAGVGYNWNFLNTMIFVTTEYEDESFIQAYRRGIRGKRETPLRIVLLAYRNTIEEYIYLQVEKKSRDANLVDETKDELFLISKPLIETVNTSKVDPVSLANVKIEKAQAQVGMGGVKIQKFNMEDFI